MKNLCTYLVLFFLGFSLLAFVTLNDENHYSGKDIKTIKGFMLKKTVLKKGKPQALKTLIGGAKTKVIKIDGQGIVRPGKGYKMVLDTENQKIAVIASSAKYNPLILGLDGHEVPWGLYLCYCPQYPDDCEFMTYNTEDPLALSLDCEGSCGCGVAFIPKETSVDWTGSEGRGLF